MHHIQFRNLPLQLFRTQPPVTLFRTETLLNIGNKYLYTIQGAGMEFKIAIEQDEDGWYIVTVPSLPGCVSQGRTEEEAKKNIAEAIELHLSALARDGIPLYHRPGVKETFVAVDI